MMLMESEDEEETPRFGAMEYLQYLRDKHGEDYFMR
jgi:hypothetical protein